MFSQNTSKSSSKGSSAGSGISATYYVIQRDSNGTVIMSPGPSPMPSPFPHIRRITSASSHSISSPSSLEISASSSLQVTPSQETRLVNIGNVGIDVGSIQMLPDDLLAMSTTDLTQLMHDFEGTVEPDQSQQTSPLSIKEEHEKEESEANECNSHHEQADDQHDDAPIPLSQRSSASMGSERPLTVFSPVLMLRRFIAQNKQNADRFRLSSPTSSCALETTSEEDYRLMREELSNKGFA